MATNNTLAPYGVGPQGQGGGNLLTNALGGFGELMQNKNLLKAMAQAGTLLDPEGAGGVIGQPTVGWIESQAAGEAAEKQQALSKERLEQLIPLMGGKADYDENGKLKSLTGNSKMSPEIMQGLIQSLGGGSGTGSELGSLSQPSGAAAQDDDDMIESTLDNLMQKFGLGGM